MLSHLLRQVLERLILSGGECLEDVAAPRESRFDTHQFRIDRRSPEPFKHMVQRRGQVGSRVGERAIEVEGDDIEGKGGHRVSALDRFLEKGKWPSDFGRESAQAARPMEMARFPWHRAA
jgi:hypothetical protein